MSHTRFQLLLRERRVLVALVALVYTALFMPAVLEVQPRGVPLFNHAMMLVSGFLYSWVLFFTLRAVRPLFLLLVPLLFATSAGASYYMYQYQFEMTFQQLAVVTEVDPRTAYAFITLKLVLWLAITTAIGIAISLYAVRREIRDPKDNRLLLITGIVLVCVFTQEVGSITGRYFPYNLLFAVRDFAQEKLTMTAGTEAKIAVTYPKAEPVTVVLVVGESVRAQNWGLNGYARQTTPELAKRGDLINFTDVTSCFPLTRVAVPCILTNASYTHAVRPEYSLLRLFREMGFFTASIDMHGMSNSVFGSPVTSLFNEGNQLVSLNGSILKSTNVDDAGVEQLRQILGEQQGNLFLFFHPFGSHWPFDTRYPERFRQFTPVCNPSDPRLIGLAKDMSECVPQELVNAYDNSILYADHVLSEVIDAVKDRPALVLFTSDHGQSLGENGLFLHGHEHAEMERKVPMAIWASPSFAKRYAPALAAMRAKQQAPTSHDVIFHSLLDCIGARGEMIDPAQSLCH